jgi:hypothetical protein
VRFFVGYEDMDMAFDPNTSTLLDPPACGKFDPAAWAEANYEGGVAAQLQADPKKQGKAKKPDANLVSLVYPDPG